MSATGIALSHKQQMWLRRGVWLGRRCKQLAVRVRLLSGHTSGRRVRAIDFAADIVREVLLSCSKLAHCGVMGTQYLSYGDTILN